MNGLEKADEGIKTVAKTCGKLSRARKAMVRHKTFDCAVGFSQLLHRILPGQVAENRAKFKIV
jgi:hypothetical protein